MIPKTMTGVQLVAHGGPECLVLNHEIPVPTPCAGEVLVKVHAAGVNNTDINTRIGWYSKSDNDADDAAWTGEALKLPLIQGADVCGEIVAVGDGVDPSRIGQRILIEPSMWEARGRNLTTPWYFGSECDGGFAEYATVASRHAHAIDSPLTSVELASFPCSYSTAENMLTRAGVGSDDTVLVTGASGGVGSAAIQLVKARGATVIAVTSPSKAAELMDLGAAKTLSRNDDLPKVLGRNSVDVVIDLVAGAAWPQLLEVLRPKGRYAVSGAIGGPIVELDVRTLYLKDLSFFGCTVLEPEVFPNLITRIERQEIKPLVAQEFALAQINAAQEAFQKKSHIGKIVLRAGKL
ncbi:alcohol dehydrogenase family protein [Actibacterium pelagium]